MTNKEEMTDQTPSEKNAREMKADYPGQLNLSTEKKDPNKIRCIWSPIRLHIELVRTDASNEEKLAEGTEILQKFGGVQYGNTISRDIIVPSEMRLFNLNYAIQKCFGFQNSHLHSFTLSDEQFQKLTNWDFNNFTYLVGVAFRSPLMDDDAVLFMEDYDGGNLNTWLRKKYRGPYFDMIYEEGITSCKNDVETASEMYAYVELEHWFTDDGNDYYCSVEPIPLAEYWRRVKAGPVELSIAAEDGDKKGATNRVVKEFYPFNEIPMDAVHLMFFRAYDELLERLPVSQVLCIKDGGIQSTDFENPVPESFEGYMDMHPRMKSTIRCCVIADSSNHQPNASYLTDTLLYHYDFGDGWTVKITGSSDASDLVESGRVTQEELDGAVYKMHTQYLPVCIAQDGLSVMDDVGGMSGYIEFLKGINKQGDPEGPYADAKDSLVWAKSMGWRKKPVSNNRLL